MMAMTEKRFRYEGAQIFDDDEFLCCTLSIWKKQLVDLLNDLHEENIKLHIQNDFLKDENQHMRDLVNENEQLKKENNQLELQNSTLMKEVAEYSRKAKELEKENEELKQDRFICLDCEHSGYAEIGCLCEKKDHWTDYKTECEDYKELSK